jgi:AbrB family looped-hinge helix DNA binding protein
MESVKVLAKGQIVIPARIRKKHHIQPGQKIHVFEYDGLIYLVPSSADPVGEALGCLPREPSLSEELLVDRQNERVP